jgi:Toprim domain
VSRAQEIAAALGNASREGRNWRCRCPIHDGVSLYLRDGRDSLLVWCWAGCKTSAILGELRQRGWLDDRSTESTAMVKFAISHGDHSKPYAKPADTSNVEAALRLWDESIDPRGTLVERYLIGRGLTLPPRRGDGAIHFHPRCPFKSERVPAMVALFRDIRTDEPCGIHRTALLCDGGERDRKRGKAMLGRASGAAIKISPDDEVILGLGITEGIETALAIIGSGWRPVWAAASAGGIAQFPILSGPEELTIFADRDGTGQKAAQECGRRWREADHLVTIHPAPGAHYAWP